MKFIKLLFGLLFLSNPFLSYFDFLPDFIGILLIISALKPVEDISPSAESAIQSFKKAALFSGIQLVLMFPILPIISNEPSFSLLFNAVFAILRVVFLIPAFHNLFDSLSYFTDKAGQKTAKLNIYRTITGIFIITSSVLSAFPECVYLYVDEYAEFGTHHPLAMYKTGLIVLSAAIALIFGIIWYVISAINVLAIRKNTKINEVINADIANNVVSKKKEVMKSLSPMVFALIISSFSLLTYYIDGKPLIPPIITPIFHITALHYSNKLVSKRTTKAFSVITLILSLPLSLGYELFGYSAHNTALISFKAVKDKFMLPFILDCVYTVFAIASVICVFIALYRVIQTHTGLFWEKEFITHNTEAQKSKGKQLLMCVLICILLCIVLTLNLTSYAILYKSQNFNNICSLITLASAILATYLYTEIKSSVIEKYSTDNTLN